VLGYRLSEQRALRVTRVEELRTKGGWLKSCEEHSIFADFSFNFSSAG